MIPEAGTAMRSMFTTSDLILFLFYSLHSILHGRPFPLKGRFMANVFIHFEPTGPINGQMEFNGVFPPYVVDGTDEAERWRASHPNGHSIMETREFATGSSEAHRYASTNDIFSLRKLLDRKAEVVNVRDTNGWTPLHEAVREGHMKAVNLLLERGGEVNARTGRKGEGGSALDWALSYHGEDHEMIAVLEGHGGKAFESAEQEF